MKVGVLALQGNFREHRQMLEKLGAEVREVRLPEHLQSLDALIVPGGESTTIGRLAREYGLEDAIRNSALPVWGTCAGAIWLTKTIEGRPTQERLGLLDAEIQRNAYGRQVDSFHAPISVRGLDAEFPAIFIRAPGFSAVGPGVEVLARFGERPVLVREGRFMASTFHPELSGDSRLHAMFLGLVSSRDLKDEDRVKRSPIDTSR